MKGILTRFREKFASTAQMVESVPSPKSSGTNVLVVDDDNAVCRIVQRMLSDQHYQVQTSKSVADAILAIEQKSFDAYVIDYKLPNCLTVPDLMSQSGFDRKGAQLRSFLCRDMTQVPLHRERRSFVYLISSKNPFHGRRSVTQ